MEGDEQQHIDNLRTPLVVAISKAKTWTTNMKHESEKSQNTTIVLQGYESQTQNLDMAMLLITLGLDKQ
jgi:hypothetical protein